MGRSSIRLGRIFGIPVGLDLSLLLIAGLLTFSLAVDRFPTEFPGEPTAAYWVVALVAAATVFGVKAAFSRRQVTPSQPVREVGQPADRNAPRSRPRPDVEDELTRLRRELRDMQ